MGSVAARWRSRRTRADQVLRRSGIYRDDAARRVGTWCCPRNHLAYGPAVLISMPAVDPDQTGAPAVVFVSHYLPRLPPADRQPGWTRRRRTAGVAVAARREARLLSAAHRKNILRLSCHRQRTNLGRVTGRWPGNAVFTDATLGLRGETWRFIELHLGNTGIGPHRDGFRNSNGEPDYEHPGESASSDTASGAKDRPAAGNETTETTGNLTALETPVCAWRNRVKRFQESVRP